MAEDEEQCVDDFCEIVRWDVRGHSDRDPHHSVEQEIRETGGKDRRLLHACVVVIPPVDRVLLYIGEQVFCDLRHLRLGIPHRGGRISIHGTEISLSVDQWVPHAEILGHANHGIIYGDIPVRMVFSQHVSDHTRRFPMLSGSSQS